MHFADVTRHSVTFRSFMATNVDKDDFPALGDSLKTRFRLPRCRSKKAHAMAHYWISASATHYDPSADSSSEGSGRRAFPEKAHSPEVGDANLHAMSACRRRGPRGRLFRGYYGTSATRWWSPEWGDFWSSPEAPQLHRHFRGRPVSRNEISKVALYSG